MSKKLPKAIGRTLDDMRSIAAEVRAETERTAVRRTVARSSQPMEVEPAAEAAQPPAAAAQAPAALVPAAPMPAVAVPALPAPVSAASPAPAAGTLVATMPGPSIEDYKVMLRRARARELVERHAKYAAAGGLIPLPIVDVAGVTAIIVRLVRQLARLYEVSERRDRTRAIVLGLLGGVAPVGIGAMATAGFMRFVPGANLLSMAVTSIAAAACTRSIGLIFLEHFESGGTLLDFKVERKAAH
jgi:uncharacterized protein (DUF697 family)